MNEKHLLYNNKTMGVLFGLRIGNMGMLGIGLLIGMAIGLGLGSSMDKKAYNEGRQLDF